MGLKDYFNKSAETSDKSSIEGLRTHYYRGRVEQVTEAVCTCLKKDGAIVRNVDNERHEINFDSAMYSGVATLSVVSFTEIAVDFNLMTFNILPGQKGKKAIERLYSYLDRELELKKMNGLLQRESVLLLLIKKLLKQHKIYTKRIKIEV